MNYKEAASIIDDLLENTKNRNYYIDFVPFTFQNEDYAELEAYLNNHYKKVFAAKIKFIAFSLIYYYDSYIYLDQEVADSLYPDLKDKDLRNIGLERLAGIIDKMIIDNYSGLSILLKVDDHFSLLRIEDGFDTYLFNVDAKAYKNMNSLIDHQGLYLKTIIE